METILNAIPQRPPFLFVDTIKDQSDNSIHTQKVLTGEEDFFKGHFPGNPIMPGVLLCEACFQSAAILMSRLSGGGDRDNRASGLGVVTRIRDTKFKNFARPGDRLDVHVFLEERIGYACYMKGKICVSEKTILQIKFQVAMVNK